MKLWESRWHDGRIGFHLSEVNSYLTRHSKKLLIKKNEKVFVPFCGKSRDLIWLAERTKKVVGVELVRKPVEDFFKENDINYTSRRFEKFELFESTSIDIFQGDFFELKSNNIFKFEAIYDRASIVSIEKVLREKYVDHLFNFIADGGRILLITLEYDQKQMNGPPYSVSFSEVENLFSQYGNLKLLETRDILDERLRKKGLDGILERVIQIKKK